MVRGEDEEATKQLTAQDLLIKNTMTSLPQESSKRLLSTHGKKSKSTLSAVIPKRLTLYRAIHSYTNARTGKSKTLADRVLLFGKVSYYTMDTGSRIKLVREHRGLYTTKKLGEMLGYGKSSANRIAQYEMGYRSPSAPVPYGWKNSASLFVGALKGHCPGVGFRHRCQRTGTGFLQAGSPLRHRCLAVYADDLCGGAERVVTSKLFPQTLVLAEAATADASRRDSPG